MHCELGEDYFAHVQRKWRRKQPRQLKSADRLTVDSQPVQQRQTPVQHVVEVLKINGECEFPGPVPLHQVVCGLREIWRYQKDPDDGEHTFSSWTESGSDAILDV